MTLELDLRQNSKFNETIIAEQNRKREYQNEEMKANKERIQNYLQTSVSQEKVKC
jgi:hypothetical protein